MRLKNFINLSQQESREVFLWRNSEEISCFMKTKNISWEEHIAFLEKLKEEVTKQYFWFLMEKWQWVLWILWIFKGEILVSLESIKIQI